MSILLIVLYALMSASFFVLAALADGKTVKVLNSLLVGQLYSYYNQRIGNLITTSVQEIGLQKTKK